MRVVFVSISMLLTSCSAYDNYIKEGTELAKSNQNEDAINQFHLAIKKNDKRIEAYYGLGYAYANICRSNSAACEKGINYFSIVLAKDSSYRHALYNRANCYLQLEDYNKALTDLTNELCKEKEDADYFGNRAICQLALGDTLAAMENYNSAVRLDPSKHYALYDRMFEEFLARQLDKE